jgi:hypothetical protein
MTPRINRDRLLGGLETFDGVGILAVRTLGP